MKKYADRFLNDILTPHRSAQDCKLSISFWMNRFNVLIIRPALQKAVSPANNPKLRGIFCFV